MVVDRSKLKDGPIVIESESNVNEIGNSFERILEELTGQNGEFLFDQLFEYNNDFQR